MNFESKENHVKLVLSAVEKSPSGLSLPSLLSATGLSRVDTIRALSALSDLGLLREDVSSEQTSPVWLDRSKFYTQKLVDFNPSLLDFDPEHPEFSACRLLPEHKRDIVKSISSIPFYFQRDFSNPHQISDEDANFYAFKRSFESFLYDGVFEANDDSRYIGASHCCSRSLFRALESISPDAKLTLADLARINALFDDDYNPLLDGSFYSSLRSTPLSFKDSLYSPLKSQKAVEIFTQKVLLTSHQITNPLDRAFYLNLNTMYVQPFLHANKRTAAVASNTSLLAAGLAPYTHSMHSKDSFISAFLDYCEYADAEPMSYVFSQAVIQSSVKFEQTFNQFSEVLKVASPSEIRKISANIVRTMFKDNLSPAECINSAFPEDSSSAASKIVRSEVSNLLWQLDQCLRDGNVLAGHPDLIDGYRQYREALKFDSMLADRP